jgi:hypothetical protein
MNERHEQLMAQAWIEFAPDAKAVTKRFAELIVAECMNIVSNQTTLDTNEDFREGFNHGLKYAWTDIRKHFGVKE